MAAAEITRILGRNLLTTGKINKMYPKVRHKIFSNVNTVGITTTTQQSVRDIYNLKSHKYVCITTYQPDTKFSPNHNPNPNPTTKQHVIVNI